MYSSLDSPTYEEWLIEANRLMNELRYFERLYSNKITECMKTKDTFMLKYYCLRLLEAKKKLKIGEVKLSDDTRYYEHIDGVKYEWKFVNQIKSRESIIEMYKMNYDIDFEIIMKIDYDIKKDLKEVYFYKNGNSMSKLYKSLQDCVKGNKNG